MCREIYVRSRKTASDRVGWSNHITSPNAGIDINVRTKGIRKLNFEVALLLLPLLRRRFLLPLSLTMVNAMSVPH